MKKLFVFAIMTMFLGAGAVTALPIVSNADSEISIQQGEPKKEIKKDDLPDAVKETLKEDRFADWKIDKVYKVAKADGTQYYSIDFIGQGNQTATMKFDDNGDVIQ